MFRLLCWNIQAGPTDAQLAHLLDQRDADLLVLTEFVRLRPQEPPSPTLTVRERQLSDHSALVVKLDSDASAVRQDAGILAKNYSAPRS